MFSWLVDKMWNIRAWLFIRTYPSGPWYYRYTRTTIEGALSVKERIELRKDLKRMRQEAEEMRAEAKRMREEMDRIFGELFEELDDKLR